MTLFCDRAEILGVNGRDHAIAAGTLCDAEGAILTFLEILAKKRRKQPNSLTEILGEFFAIEQCQNGVPIAGKLIHQHLTRIRVIPIANGFPRRGVAVVTLQHSADPRLCLLVAAAKYAPNARTNQCHGVLRRDCVVQRR